MGLEAAGPQGQKEGLREYTPPMLRDDCQRLPMNISYEQWITFVFDHPENDSQGAGGGLTSRDSQDWDDLADPALTLSFLTRLFENPEDLMRRFSRRQIDQGLRFIIHTGESGHMLVLQDTSLPWTSRLRCIEAMVPLFERLMAPVYQDDIGHTRKGPGDPARPVFACYMWWDIVPLWGLMEMENQGDINNAVLLVLERILTLPADSCVESALHGLGHWQYVDPHRVGRIIERFLARSNINPELRRYAESARVGHVE